MDAPREYELVVADINAVLRGHGAKLAKQMEHDAFMSVANASYAIVLTGGARVYGNCRADERRDPAGEVASRS